MRGKRIPFLKIAGLTLAILAGIPDLGSGALAADKPESITVAVISDHVGGYTGAFKSMSHALSFGAEDATKYLNEDKGGIDGVKIKLVVKDSEGNAALGLKQYAEIMAMNPKPLFVCGAYTGVAFYLRDKVKADDVIGFFPSATSTLYPPKNGYGFFALYSEQAAVAVKWVKDNWKESRPPRIAIVTWDNEYGKAFMVPEFFDFCKKIGVEIVAQEVFPVKEKNLVNTMIRVRAKQPDWILTNCAPPAPAHIMEASKSVGLNAKILNGIGGDPMGIAENPTLFEGCISVLPTVSLDDDLHPGIKHIKEIQSKFGRSSSAQSCYYIHGMRYILMVEKTVRSAVTKVGWEKLDTNALKGELNQLTDWEPLDGVVRISYSDTMRATPWQAVFKVEGGKLVPAGGVGGDGKFLRGPDFTPK